MNQKSKFIITSAMAGIATAACAVCMTQSAYASETDKVTDDKPAIAVTKDTNVNDDMLMKSAKKLDEVKNADVGKTEVKDGEKSVNNVVAKNEVKNAGVKDETKSDEKPITVVKDVNENRGGDEKTVKNENSKNKNAEVNKNENVASNESKLVEKSEEIHNYVVSNELLNRTGDMFTTGYSNEDAKSDFNKNDRGARIYFKSNDNENVLCTTDRYNINVNPTIPIAAPNGDGIYTICAVYKVNDFCKTVSIGSSMEIRSALDKNIVMPNGDLRLQKSNIFKESSYDLSTDVSTNRIKYIKINGQSVPLNINQITVSNDVKFGKDASKFIFVEIAYDRKKTDMNCKIKAAIGPDVHNEYSIELQDYQGGSVEFHYVNDMQYRKQQHLTVNQKLPERCVGEKYIDSNGDWVLSHKPFYEIKNINDLGNFITPKAMFAFDELAHFLSDKANAYISNKEDYNDDLPILQTNRVVSKTPIMPYDNTVFNSDFADKNTFINKTIIKSKDGIKYCDMPGYVYWDNDIDKPNNINREFDNDAESTVGFGNHYLTYAYEMKDGKPVKLLTRKHYYVTYRALPTQLTVQYQGLDGKLIDAQPYAILQNGKAIQSWKSRWLSSDKKIEHKSYEDMYNFVKGKRYDIADYQVYDYNGDAYLMPGDYTIAPAIKAPDGYEWVTEKIDNAGNMLQTVKTGEGTDNVHIDVLSNKNIDKNVCQYGIRFVLRKIGDEVLNNVVALPGLPQKPVEPVLNETISGDYKNPNTNFENSNSKIDPNVSGKVDSKVVFNKSFNNESKESIYDIISNTSMEQSVNPYPDVFTDNEWKDFVKSSGNSTNKHESNVISKTFYSADKNKKFVELQKPDDNYYYDTINGYYITYFVHSWNPENVHNNLMEKQRIKLQKGGYLIKGGPVMPPEQHDSYLNNLDSFQLFNKELFDGKHDMNISVKSTSIKHGNVLVYGKVMWHILNNNKYTLYIPVKINSDIYTDVHDSYITVAPFKATAKAVYHFVDDFQYRHVQKVDNQSQLKRRGANETGISDNDVVNYASDDFSNNRHYDLSETPYHMIYDCKDIDSVIAVNTFGTREVHNLNYAYSVEPNSITPSGVYWDDKNKQYTDPAEPSLNQLTYKNIPGYVYIDNDIDKPIVYKYAKNDPVTDSSFKYKKDRFYVGFAPLHWTDAFEDGYYNNIMPCDYLIVPFEKRDKDGNVMETLSTKHYYVTFRKIPTRLIVQYKDPNGNLVDGKRYNLLQDNKALLTAKNPVLTTSHWDGYYDDFDNLKAFVQSKDYDVFGKNNVYYKDGQTYLTDGDYQIQAGVDAPEGYEWVPEVKGGDKFHIDLVKSAKDPTVKVVTMVLRKKPGTVPHISMVVVPTPKPVPPTSVTPVTPQPITPEHHDVTPVVPPVVTVPETTIPNVVPEHTKDIPVVENPDLAKLVNNTDTQKAEAHDVKAKPVVSKAIKHAKQQLPKTGAGIVTMLALGLQTMVAGVAMKFKKRK